MPNSQQLVDQILLGKTQDLFKFLTLFDGRAHYPLETVSPSELRYLINRSISNLDKTKDATVSKPQTTTPSLAATLSQLAPYKSITHEHFSSLHLIDILLDQLWIHTQPHEIIKPQVHALLLQCGCHFLLRPDLLITREHPFTRLLIEMIHVLSIWEPPPGRLGRRLPEELNTTIDQLSTLDINDRSMADKILANFISAIEEEQKRAETVAQRLIQSEISSVNTETARRSVVTYIDTRLSGKPLPNFVITFIKTRLATDLQYLVITQGVDSALWKQWKRIIQVLSWAFLPADSPAQKNKTQTLLMPLMEQLDKQLYSGFTDTEAYHDFFNDLVQQFIQVLQQKNLLCSNFEPIAPSTQQPQITISQNRIEDLSHINPGNWFRIFDNQKATTHAQLLYKDPQKDLLLFSDYNGKIIRKDSYEDFIIALASNTAEPIYENDIFQQSFKASILSFHQEYLQWLDERNHLDQAELKKRSYKKALEEIESLNENTVSKIQELSNSERDTLTAEIESLNTGSWLLLKRANTDPIKIKLSIKLKAQDKYIFTDRVGHRIAELSLSELIQLMASGQLDILIREKDFENSLENIVRQIRSNKS